MRILRGLKSRLLPCGCLAGIYETYDGIVVALLDDRSPDCRIPLHVAGAEVPEFSLATRDSEALHTDGQGKS
jgi:hypothetical protein